MPSKKQYNLVSDDAYDSRIPLHSEEAFQHGISFNAKYIGTLDVPRPSSRVEIVAAMRRIRYEFKAKSIKKKKVTITISVDGVKIVLRKKHKNQWAWDDNRYLIMNHPIYRIFYVSHDSQDLKIFSYIARDGGSNAFKCNVFKSKKKSQAMRVVRTIGQAFEVCHKLSLANASNLVTTESLLPANHHSSSENSVSRDKDPSEKFERDSTCCDDTKPLAPHTEQEEEEEVRTGTTQEPASKTPAPTTEGSQQTLLQRQVSTTSSNQLLACPQGGAGDRPLPSPNSGGGGPLSPEGSLSLYHQLHLMRAQMEHQAQQSQSAISQARHLRDQLVAEASARNEAVSQNQQLIMHNRELLQHIHILVKHIQELEKKINRLEGKGDHLQPDLSPSPLQMGPPPRFLDLLSGSQPLAGGKTPPLPSLDSLDLGSSFPWLQISSSPPAASSSPPPATPPHTATTNSSPSIGGGSSLQLRLDDLSFSGAMKPAEQQQQQQQQQQSRPCPPLPCRSPNRVIPTSLPDLPVFADGGSGPSSASPPPWSTGPTSGGSTFLRQFSVPLPRQQESALNRMPDIGRLTIDEGEGAKFFSGNPRSFSRS